MKQFFKKYILLLSVFLAASSSGVVLAYEEFFLYEANRDWAIEAESAGNYAKALEHLNIAEQYNDISRAELFVVLTKKAENFLKLNKPAEALEELEKAETLNIKNPLLYSLLNAAYEQKGDVENAKFYKTKYERVKLGLWD